MNITFNSANCVKLEPTSPQVSKLEGTSQDTSPTDEELPQRDNCSICLQSKVDRTVIPTCAHEFCFECILIWTEQSRKCPLCSQAIGEYLIHNIRSNYDYQKQYLPAIPSLISARTPTESSRIRMQQTRRRERIWGRRERQQRAEADQLDTAIARRRLIYQHDLYAKHIASNTFTRFHPYPTPAQFSTSPDLHSRMTVFLRRELQVWPNMDVEFLTTFIISLMKSIDIRSESAIKLLAEFLDMDTPYRHGSRFRNAEHFAHEIYTFLRSPYRDLTVYDTVVQYDFPSDIAPASQSERHHRWCDVSYSRSRSPTNDVPLPSRSPSPPRQNGGRARSSPKQLSDQRHILAEASTSRARSPIVVPPAADFEYDPTTVHNYEHTADIRHGSAKDDSRHDSCEGKKDGGYVQQGMRFPSDDGALSRSHEPVRMTRFPSDLDNATKDVHCDRLSSPFATDAKGKFSADGRGLDNMLSSIRREGIQEYNTDRMAFNLINMTKETRPGPSEERKSPGPSTRAPRNRTLRESVRAHLTSSAGQRRIHPSAVTLDEDLALSQNLAPSRGSKNSAAKIIQSSSPCIPTTLDRDLPACMARSFSTGPSQSVSGSNGVKQLLNESMACPVLTQTSDLLAGMKDERCLERTLTPSAPELSVDLTGDHARMIDSIRASDDLGGHGHPPLANDRMNSQSAVDNNLRSKLLSRLEKERKEALEQSLLLSSASSKQLHGMETATVCYDPDVDKTSKLEARLRTQARVRARMAVIKRAVNDGINFEKKSSQPGYEELGGFGRNDDTSCDSRESLLREMLHKRKH